MKDFSTYKYNLLDKNNEAFENETSETEEEKDEDEEEIIKKEPTTEELRDLLSKQNSNAKKLQEEQQPVSERVWENIRHFFLCHCCIQQEPDKKVKPLYEAVYVKSYH